MNTKAGKISPFKFVFTFLSVITLFVLSVNSYLIITNKSGNNICANSISCIRDLSGAYKTTKEGVFFGRNIKVPDFYYDDKAILGVQSGLNKHIYIDLSKQQLTAFEGEKKVFDFPISSGKWYPTPTGTFSVWIKLRYTSMIGGNKDIGTYYNLPNVPHTMYFYNAEIPKTRGFGMHGAYWHNNFGHPMSHGCVNIGLENVAKLYDWVDPPSTGNTTYATSENPGTQLTIFGVAPKE